MCFALFLLKSMQHFSEKTQFLFPVSPGSAEAQVRWGGKIKYVLNDYFLGNIRAKNYHNQTVYVKIIASQRWDVFLRHGVVLSKTQLSIDNTFFATLYQ